MDKEAAIGHYCFLIGIIGWVGYLAAFGANNAIIAASSTSVTVLGIHILDISKQRRRMAKMEARVTELESKQRD